VQYVFYIVIITGDNEMIGLDRAIELAVYAHLGQKDRGDWSYILHPIHVMMKIKEGGGTEDEMIVAVLHDAVEDSKGKVTIESLKTEGMTETQLNALIAMTHNKEDDYLDVYIQKIKSNSIARKVKIEDLKHNTDITRLKNRNNLKTKDLERLGKYGKAYEILAG
jgi:hypothetical protein